MLYGSSILLFTCGLATLIVVPTGFLFAVFVLGVVLTLIAAWGMRKRGNAFNLVLAFGIAATAIPLAAHLSPTVILGIFTLLAAYDMVAVYATGHMQRMFRGLAAKGVMLAFVVPSTSGTFHLGIGDVLLPAMLASAAVREHLTRGFAVTLGAMAGYALMFLLYLRQSPRRPMAAFPPIALGAAVGYLLSLLI